MNLASILEATTRQHPDRVAVKSMGRNWTYAELNAQANRLANGLTALGIQRGDKVALSCISTADFVAAFYGIVKMGAVAVPLNLLLKRDEIAEQLRESKARAYLCFEGAPEMPMGQFGYEAFQAAPQCEHFFIIPAHPDGQVRMPGQTSWNALLESQSPEYESIQTRGDETCSITFTSGTSGIPKGTEHSHANEFLCAVLVRDECDVRTHDVILSALPLFSGWRCAIMHAAFLSASTVVLLPRFQPAEVWQTIAREQVTNFFGVAPMFYGMRMAMEPAQVDVEAVASHWRSCSFGGIPMDFALRQFFQQTFGLTMCNGYGLTEVFFAVLDKADARDVPGYLGRAIPGVQVRVVDENMNDVAAGEIGELVIRSPTMMKGYFNHPEWTEEAFRGGWFHSGDLGRQDEEGNLYLVDRSKDMINRSGFKVYPAQLEAVLRTHPAVANVACIGVPAERVGEEVRALVVLKPDTACTEEEFIAWSRERVAAYAYPREVRFVESLPMTPTGKVLKRLLRDAQG